MWNRFPRDEREVAIDQAGDRLAYLVISYGVLVVVAWRSFVEGVATFELLALVVLSGAVGAAYRARHRAFTRDSAIVLGVTILGALVVAVLIAVLLRP
ncbi:MAG TPA: hypothetical protein VK867_11675 [Candidatus Limnocylindrales bacterium]|nr:hypothetical protein [Candidatus Limnocylindrales bacterium]